MNIETNPGTGLLALGIIVAILLGVITLTGAWALIIWIAIVLVIAFVVYFVGVRFAKWSRGEWSPRRRRRGGGDDR